MKKTFIITGEEGEGYATNWMLDHIIEAFEKRGMNNGSNDDLIKELTIQKIEYGRICMSGLIMGGGQTLQAIKSCYNENNVYLREKIIELGGEPDAGLNFIK